MSFEDSRARVDDAMGTVGYENTAERLAALTEFAKRNATNVDTGYRQFGGEGVTGLHVGSKHLWIRCGTHTP